MQGNNICNLNLPCCETQNIFNVICNLNRALNVECL